MDIDECESEPCQNGATCEDRINAYACLCSAGFRGESLVWRAMPSGSGHVHVGGIKVTWEGLVFPQGSCVT